MSKSSHREVKQQLTEKSSAAVQGLIKLATCLQKESGAEVSALGNIHISAYCTSHCSFNAIALHRLWLRQQSGSPPRKHPSCSPCR